MREFFVDISSLLFDSWP